MRVAVVVPHTEKVAQDQYHMIPQLGVGYLAGSLRANGHECVVVDAKMSRLDHAGVVDRIRAAKPRVVALSAMTHEITRAHDIAGAVKSDDPSVTTFVGGCHVSALPGRQTLEEFPHFDCVMQGESEVAFPEALKRLESDGIRGLGDAPGASYRMNGEIRDNGHAPMIPEIDSIPHPGWEVFPRTTVYPLFTSRGCPYACNFCQRVQGKRMRYRDPEAVVEELKRLVHEFGAKDIRIRDEEYALSKPHVTEICELMLKEGLHKAITWSCVTHCNTVTRELLALMKKAGCHLVGYGVESGNTEILAGMGKHLKKDRVRQAIRDTKAVGLKTGTYWIFGHPGETPETVEDTIRFAVELNSDEVAFGSMVPYPGTDLYEMAKRGEGGYKNLSSNWADYNKYLGNPVQLEKLSRRDLDRAQMKAYVAYYAKNLRIVGAMHFFAMHWKPIMSSVLGLMRSSLPKITPRLARS